MIQRFVAIGLKIPDNEAYTALVTLQRLGVAVERLERCEIWQLDDTGDGSSIGRRIEANEAIFNPNKHRLRSLEQATPRTGEVWIDRIGEDADVRIAGVAHARRYVGWRLFGAAGAPVRRDVVVAAVERLLCNPAIERALY